MSEEKTAIYICDECGKRINAKEEKFSIYILCDCKTGSRAYQDGMKPVKGHGVHKNLKWVNRY